MRLILSWIGWIDKLHGKGDNCKKRKDFIRMDEKTYKKLEAELTKCRIDQEAEDILLDLAEMLAEKGAMEKEISVKENYGKTVVEALGTCSPDEGGDEEPSVYIRLLRVGKAEFEIEDYFL